jgi:hypothetical protein
MHQSKECRQYIITKGSISIVFYFPVVVITRSNYYYKPQRFAKKYSVAAIALGLGNIIGLFVDGFLVCPKLVTIASFFYQL